MNFAAELKLPSPVTQIHSPLLTEKKIELFIKRDELIHPVIQGNKWRKLKYNLQQAQYEQKNTILSFGGAYSNHLHALAAAGKISGFNTIGIIRGEAPRPLNPCLQDMLNWGMQLEFIQRIEYKQKTDSIFIENLKQSWGDFYLIPEGGNNPAGIKGCAEILDELKDEYDFICSEVGSGTMLSALILNNKTPQTQIIGFSVMKNLLLEQDIKNNLSATKKYSDWKIIHNYHFNGFAKTTTELDNFIKNFKLDFDIQLEPVYSGKMLYAIFDLIKQDYFQTGSKLLAIHGGGLQGLRGFPQYNYSPEYPAF